MQNEVDYIVGLTMSHNQGPAALAIVERYADLSVEGGYKMRAVTLDRSVPGTSLEGIVEWVKGHMSSFPLDQLAAVVVGGSRVDPAFVTLLEEAGFAEKLQVVLVTDDDDSRSRVIN